MIKNKLISVVIPCYKVQEFISDVINEIPEFIDHIITVVDGCPNGTLDVLNNINNEKLKIYSISKNQGTGSAMKLGIEHALELKSDIIVKIDGDGQMDSSQMKKFILPIVDENIDYVRGNRFKKLTSLRQMPKLRLFGNSILTFFFKISSGYWGVSDIASGYTAISRNSLEIIDYKKLSNDYFYDSSVFLNIALNNLYIRDVAIDSIYGNERSNLNIFKIIISFPFKIFRHFIKRIGLQYFLYDFNMGSIYILLGVPCFIFGIVYGLYRWSLATNGIVNPGGELMIVLLSILIGFQLLLSAISIDIEKGKKYLS